MASFGPAPRLSRRPSPGNGPAAPSQLVAPISGSKAVAGVSRGSSPLRSSRRRVCSPPLAWGAVSLRGWEQLCQRRECLARYGRGPVAFRCGRSGRGERRAGGAGHGVYGEASPVLTLGERTALFVSGGRYPTDPVSGGVAGRYVSAGLRLRTALVRPRVRRDPQPLGRPPASGDGEAGFAARLELQPAFDGTFRVVLYALARATVEVAGDFTDWQPVALRRAGEDTWECWLRIPSGIHRINVRIDGGRWTAPAGTTRASDEFGGEVGTVAVP